MEGEAVWLLLVLPSYVSLFLLMFVWRFTVHRAMAMRLVLRSLFGLIAVYFILPFIAALAFAYGMNDWRADDTYLLVALIGWFVLIIGGWLWHRKQINTAS